MGASGGAVILVLHVVEAVLHDVDGVYTRLFDDLAAHVVVVRPDLVLHGSSPARHAEELLHGLLDQLELR